MGRIKYFLKLSIVTIPTVVITLLILEKTNNLLYALLAIIITCSIMVLILYFAFKFLKK